MVYTVRSKSCQAAPVGCCGLVKSGVASGLRAQSAGSIVGLSPAGSRGHQVCTKALETPSRPLMPPRSIFVLGLAACLACGPELPIQPVPRDPSGNRPPPTGIGRIPYQVQATLSRDFMPFSPPDGKPLVAGFRIQTVDGSSIPSSVTADSAWVYNGAAVWSTAVVEEEPRSGSEFRVIARGGPKWGPGIEVDVVVRVIDAEGNRFLLKAPRQFISRTD